MVELVDTGDSKSPGFGRVGSSPTSGTIKIRIMFNKIKNKIKIAKIWVIIISVLFLAMIISNIYLNYKVYKINKYISNEK